MLLNPGVCSRVRELQEALAERIVEVEISNRNVRVAALQKRWDRLNKAFDELLDQRGADMADIPGGATGLLCKDYKGKEADQLVTRIDPGGMLMSKEQLQDLKRGLGRHYRATKSSVGVADSSITLLVDPSTCERAVLP